MRKFLLMAMAVFLLASCSSTLENTDRTSFNEGWKFYNAAADGAEQADFDDAAWRDLDLPHDWAIEGPFDIKYNARSGGLPFHGEGWYRKHFTMPKSAQGKHVTLHFDGAMYNAQVYLNGEFIGNRPFGYIGFTLDLSQHLNYGGENVIAVNLKPEDLSTRWYPGAGIYRNTWLEINNTVHVAQWGTFVTTPEVAKDKAKVNIITEVQNTEAKAKDVTVRTSIFSADNVLVDVVESKLKANAAAVTNISQDLNVENPQLWDLETPTLYTAKTEILSGSTVLDNYNTTFGIRTIKYTPEGFYLNGRQVRFNGVCLHHDHGPLGAAVNYRATERQLEIMQDMGVNAIRTSHNPPSPEQIQCCDKMGILAQVEAFDMWRKPKVENGYSKFFDEWHERDLRDMIRCFRNSPSVVMWSIGNEILEQSDKVNGPKLARHLAAIVTDEDTTRPNTAGFNYYPQSVSNKLAHEVTLKGFNYKPTKYSEVKEEHPDWIIYGSETSSCTSSRGVYHLPIKKYRIYDDNQVTSYDLIGPVWAYPPDIEFHYLKETPEALGEFIWTGFDYLGEPTPYGGRDNSTNGYWNDDWPSRSSYFGAVDLCGLPKDRFFLYQSQWSSKPMVHLLPHWNWKGMEGKKIPVYCYTNCDEAELFLNGKSLGKKVKGVDKTPIIVDFKRYEGPKPFMSPYRLSWNVPYKVGELKVVAYKDGKKLLEKVINTAGKPAKIELVPDRFTITADGTDISFVTVKILDKDGNLCPNATNLVKFDVQGAGKIAAVGNGNAATIAPFIADYREAFSGMAMLYVKAAKEAGDITVKATSEGLEATTIQLAAK